MNRRRAWRLLRGGNFRLLHEISTESTTPLPGEPARQTEPAALVSGEPTPPDPAAERAVHDYLSKLGRRGGKVTGRKGFAAMSAKQFEKICAKAKAVRCERAKQCQTT
jgi:hypothetical protein